MGPPEGRFTLEYLMARAAGSDYAKTIVVGAMKTRGVRTTGSLGGAMTIVSDVGYACGEWGRRRVEIQRVYARVPRTRICASTTAVETFYGALERLGVQDNRPQP